MTKMYDLVIKNGIVCTASETFPACIAIKDGKVAAIASEFPEEDASRVIDAEGGFITPGGIDAHVHLDEPRKLFGNVSDNSQTGSRTAVAGGTTTIIAFASQNKEDRSPYSLVKAVKEHIQSADGGLYCDYALHLILSEVSKQILDNDLPLLIEEVGVTSIKMYMTYPALKLRDNEIMTAMYMMRKHGVTAMLHAENGDMIEWMIDALESQGKTDPYYHAVSRPTKFEGEATNRAIIISEAMDTPVLFVHVSSPEAINCIREAQTRGLSIFAETCPQYTLLSAEDLKRVHHHDHFEGAKYLCSPPPRHDVKDQEAVWQGLKNGTFTILSSDHCPTMYSGEDGKRIAFKNGHNGEFKWVPNGCPGLETRLPLMFSYGVSEKRFDLQKFVEICCTNPAKLYGLYPQKGSLLPGLSDADIVIWYPEGQYKGPEEIHNSNLHHNCDYTPFEDYKITNWPRYTIVKGEVVFKEGHLMKEKAGLGNYVKRHISSIAKPQDKWLSEWRPSYMLSNK